MFRKGQCNLLHNKVMLWCQKKTVEKKKDTTLYSLKVLEILHLLSVLQKSDLIFLIKEAFLSNAIATTDDQSTSDPEASKTSDIKFLGFMTSVCSNLVLILTLERRWINMKRFYFFMFPLKSLFLSSFYTHSSYLFCVDRSALC